MNAADMEEVKKCVLKPKLRFPEFQNVGEWELKSLGKVYLFKSTNSLSRDKLNYENGLVKNIHYGDIHTKFSTLFNIENEIVPFINLSESLEKIKPENYCVEGDIVFADASEDLNDVGKSVEIIHLNGERLLSGLHTLLARQKENKIKNGFSGYLFKSDGIRNQIKKEAQGTKVLGISARRLSSIKIYFPREKKEQQKVADCLSSIDDHITAETQKLDTLKAHKKGLMQQLFPAEGETQPKLRFPEFRNAGEWESSTLENLCTAKISYGIVQAGPHVPDGMPYIKSMDLNSALCLARLARTSDAIAQKYRRSEVVPGDLVFSLRGNIGVAQIVPKDMLVANLTQGTARIRTQGPPEFYLQSLRSKPVLSRILAVSKGSTFQEISLESLRKIRLFHPEIDEQQRISDCLTFLDEMIALQFQRIATLKTHKKGLMQQLFPSLDEVKR